MGNKPNKVSKFRNGNKKAILNLGCANTRIPGSVGVDRFPRKGFVDIVHNLNEVPYPFKESSVDEIHLYHVLEHLEGPLEKIEEIYRILKPGGLLYLRVPHFSSLYAWGDITHRQAFSIQAFDILDTKIRFRDLKYTKASFKILKRKIRYFYTWPNERWYMDCIVKPRWPFGISIILKPIILVLNFLINLSPVFFERFWCYWVGGAAEIYFVMEAIKDEI